jgi:hypothetical protein
VLLVAHMCVHAHTHRCTTIGGSSQNGLATTSTDDVYEPDGCDAMMAHSEGATSFRNIELKLASHLPNREHSYTAIVQHLPCQDELYGPGGEAASEWEFVP